MTTPFQKSINITFQMVMDDVALAFKKAVDSVRLLLHPFRLYEGPHVCKDMGAYSQILIPCREMNTELILHWISYGYSVEMTGRDSYITKKTFASK